MFITFEGIEGSGKTTQINRLCQWLTAAGVDYIETLEPGGTEIGQSIRRMLLDSQSGIKNDHTELFLFAADRCEHIQQMIEPALAKGQWVICDRYIDSTFAYQYGGRQHPQQDVLDIIRFTKAPIPDLTFLLDLPVEIGLRRASCRSALDRFESEDMAFHDRVRSAYLSAVQLYPNRMVCVDVAHASEVDIEHKIKQTIQERRQ